MRSLFKVWPVLSLLALSATPALAQAPASQQPPPPRQTSTRSSTAEGFGIQIGGGPVFASLDDASAKQKAGWLVGLLMGGNRGGTVGVEADVLYGQKGAKINVPFLGEQDFDQHVIHVPVMLKINGGSGSANGVSLFGVGGGFFDWQFGSKLGSVDVSDDTDGYEVGWVVGAGIEALRVSVQGRFQRGLKSLSKEFDVANARDSHSKAFVVLVAFRLN